jgi:ubiquinone/menaquinone biosynthesis C-methylase UbiE
MNAELTPVQKDEKQILAAADNTLTFSGKADVYAMARPHYAEAAIDYILSITSPDAVFADIGAGTGIFTEELAKRGVEIYAVDPNDDMRTQLNGVLTPFTNANIINGSAETTMLPDHSVDVITVAQALHWFDLDAFKRECQRILKPGGKVVTVYNISYEKQRS